MGKSKNKVDVKKMSLKDLREVLKRATGKNKNKIVNEINSRTK